MAFWTYILRCSDRRYYTGHTEDLDMRLAQHQQGFFKGCWTYKRRPVELAWSATFPTRDEALVAERIVGGWSRAKKEALIGGDWKLLSALACPPKERAQRFPEEGFSTSLETNGVGGEQTSSAAAQTRSEAGEEPVHPSESHPTPFASSEDEKPSSAGRPT